MNQLSDVLDIKVRPVGADGCTAEREPGIEQLSEEATLAGDMAAQAVEVMKALTELPLGAHAENRLEASLVNIEGMQAEFMVKLEAAENGSNEAAVKAQTMISQRASSLRQLSEREERLLSELETNSESLNSVVCEVC